MGGFILGLVIGLVVGGGAVFMWLRRPAPPAATASVAPEPALRAPMAEPAPPAAAPDDDVRQALDATKGLLDELEGRYRGRHAPDQETEPRQTRKRRRPNRPPP